MNCIQWLWAKLRGVKKSIWRNCWKFQYFLKQSWLIQFLGIMKSGSPDLLGLSGSPQIGNVSRTTLLFLWSLLLTSHLNERSVVARTTEVYHLSSLMWEREANCIHMPSSAELNSHSTLPAKVTKLHRRQQCGYFLERTPETKLYNFQHWAIQVPGKHRNHKRRGRGEEAGAGCPSNSAFTLLCFITVSAGIKPNVVSVSSRPRQLGQWVGYHGNL